MLFIIYMKKLFFVLLCRWYVKMLYGKKKGKKKFCLNWLFSIYFGKNLLFIERSLI